MRKFEKVSLSQFKEDFLTEFPNADCYSDLESCYLSIQKPKRATRLSAGYDFYSPISFLLTPGESIKIPSGIRAYMGDTNVLFMLPRSGQGFRYFVRLANTTGVIDADYVNAKNTGHIWVKLRNEGPKDMAVSAGDAIIQGIFLEYLITVDDEQEEKAIREGGLGSTDEL